MSEPDGAFNLRPFTSAIKKIEEEMCEKGVAEGSTVMAPVRDPGEMCSRKLAIQTNLYGIRLTDPQLPIYVYAVLAYSDIGTKRTEFTKPGKIDHMVNDRKKVCAAIYSAAMPSFPWFSAEHTYFYDCQQLLFSTTKLPLSQNNGAYNAGGGKATLFAPQRCDEVVVEGKDVGEDYAYIQHVHFSIFVSEENSQSASLGDIKRTSADVAEYQRIAMQFVDIATASACQFDEHNRFVVFKHGKIFPTRSAEEQPPVPTRVLGGGKTLICGAHKSVRVIEGPQGRNGCSAAIALDSLKAAFHDREKLVNKAFSILRMSPQPGKRLDRNQIDMIGKATKGVACRTLHGVKKKVEIHGMSYETANTKVFEYTHNGGGPQPTSVANYFKKKYNLTLMYPDAPLAVSKEKGQMNCYPLEVLEVIPNQRVTIPQTTPDQSKETTKACAVPPAQRQIEIVRQSQLLNLTNSPYLKAAGIEIVSQPMQVHGRHLQPPALKFGRSKTMPADDKGEWRTSGTQFAIAGECKSWGLYAVVAPGDRFTHENLVEFGMFYMKTAESLGLRIPNPTECEIIAMTGNVSVEQQMSQRLQHVARHGCHFAFIVSSDKTTYHKWYKLEEQRSGSMVTQDIKMSTVRRIMEKRQRITMENVVAKTNVKLGGLCYAISMEHLTSGYDAFPSSRLIIGIGVARPPPTAVGETGSAPTVIGYSANMNLDQPTGYQGGWRFMDTSGDEMLSCSADVMTHVLEQYRGVSKAGEKDYAHAAPKEIIIYRNGISEGSYNLILRNEIPLMRHAMREMGCPDTKLTYIVVTKEHNVRLMKTQINASDGATGQNIMTGTVVDSMATHPKFCEFYLNSHKTLQGSAKTPRYTVLVDDSSFVLNELEMLSYGLAYAFQIVNSPVSVPAPLYIANRYAERGTNIYAAQLDNKFGDNPMPPTSEAINLNKYYTLENTELARRRINA